MRKITSVRVTEATKIRLAGVLAILAGERAGYDATMRHDPGAYISFDEVINILIDRDADHRERARKARKSKKGHDTLTQATPSNGEG